jgi:hypothetical protein
MFSNISVPVDITGAASITSDSPWSFAIVADKLIMANEARDGMFLWSGSSTISEITGSPTPPAGKYVIEYENYCFKANTSSNPERVYWSALFDPETWTANRF